MDASTRVAELGRLADTYARASNALPGGDLAEHRRLMARVFAQLQEILPLLNGPVTGATFHQQMQIIRNAQAELANGPPQLSTEPTIDVGLRAARDVLARIARSPFYDQKALAPLFAQFSAKLNELDIDRGPMHRLDAGEAVGISSRIISTMSGMLSQQLATPAPTSRAAF